MKSRLTPCLSLPQINNTSLENLSLKKAKKLIDGCKDKLDLVIKRESKYISSGNRVENLRNTSVYGHHRRAIGDASGHRHNWSNQNVYVQPPTRNMVPAPPPPPPLAAQAVDVRTKAMFTDDPATLKREEAEREGYYASHARDVSSKRHPTTQGSAPSSASSAEIRKKKTYSHRTAVAGITKSATIGHSASKADRIRSEIATRSSMAAPPSTQQQHQPATEETRDSKATSEPPKAPLTAKEKEEVDREDYYGTPAKDFAGLFERFPAPPVSPVLEKKRKSFASSNRNSVASSPSKSSTAAANNGNSNVLPPRIDRGRKPERFKTAHERLFGKSSRSPVVSASADSDALEPQPPAQASSRDSMASPEYMNSSSLSVPSSATMTTPTPLSSSSCVKSVTRTVSTVSSTGSGATSQYLRSQYQSFLSDLIRTKEPPPPPPPKPSNYQPVYLTTESLSGSRLNPPPPVLVASNSVFPPPPPVTPPASSPSITYPPPPVPVTSSHWFAEPDVEAAYEVRVRPPPPSAQDLLLTTSR